MTLDEVLAPWSCFLFSQSSKVVFLTKIIFLSPTCLGAKQFVKKNGLNRSNNNISFNCWAVAQGYMVL